MASVDAVLSNGLDLRSAANSTKVVEGEAFEFDAVNNTLFISFTGVKTGRRKPEPAFTVRIELVTSPIPVEEAAASSTEEQS